jgi:hypothetical protein
MKVQVDADALEELIRIIFGGHRSIEWFAKEAQEGRVHLPGTVYSEQSVQVKSEPECDWCGGSIMTSSASVAAYRLVRRQWRRGQRHHHPTPDLT